MFPAPPREANELRSDTSCLLKNQYTHTRTNLTMEECRALTELKQDTSTVVLTADKEVPRVIMDQQDHTNKAHSLLADTNTYRILNKDPTIKLKNKHIQRLKDIKQSGGLSNQTSHSLLADTNTCRILNKDPTIKLKNKCIQTLKDIKQSGGLSYQKYKKLYPTSAVPPKFYGLPKTHKVGTPLDP